MTQKKRYIVAVCGASGTIYGIRLLKALLSRPVDVTAIISDAGYRVMAHETDFNPSSAFRDFLLSQGADFHKKSSFTVLKADDISASPASGSFQHSGMAVAPCSMKTLADIASGWAGNLITRAADVTLKERRQLILLPRETPFNLIHLENMIRAARAGAVIMPPSPSFYTRPREITGLVDTVVARVLDHFGIENDLVKRWDGLIS